MVNLIAVPIAIKYVVVRNFKTFAKIYYIVEFCVRVVVHVSVLETVRVAFE